MSQFLHPSPCAFALPEKQVFVKDLSLGAEVNELFIISTAQQGQAKNGPYWRLEFKDVSGSISGKIWSPMSESYPDLAAGMPVCVRGRVISYRDKLELNIDGLKLLDEEETRALDMAQFMPASPYRPQDMLLELDAIVRREMTHKPWRKLIQAILKNPDVSEKLLSAPAAKNMHHAYAGGLLEHTLSVARLCMLIADNYPTIDRQTLLAGAICHDLGKLWELSSGLSIEYTTEGQLIGHISLLTEKIAPLIKKSGLETHLIDQLHHLILSHHGTHEFGSPRLPCTAEAFILHYADNIDAKMQQIQNMVSGLDENCWSPYIPSLSRSLFKPIPTPQRQETVSDRESRRTASEKAQEPLPLFS